MEEKKKIIIASSGNCTMVYSDGKVYGNKISKIEFCHEAPKSADIEITACDIPVEGESDLSSFLCLLKSIMGPEERPSLIVDLKLDGASIYKSVLQENEKKKGNVYTQIDRIIFSISQKIQDDACEVGTYAETVKALASLVEARAKQDTSNTSNLQTMRDAFRSI